MAIGPGGIDRTNPTTSPASSVVTIARCGSQTVLSFLLPCQYAVDPHHAPGDQGLQAGRQTDLSENAVRGRARSRRRFADVHGRTRQPGCRATGCYQADVVMLAGGAQLMLDHPRILHKLGEIEDTAVRTE